MSKIKEFFQSLVKAGTIPQEPMNYDAATLKIYIDHLEAENAALRSRLEEAVVVKAKVDDTIYLPWIYDGVSGVGKLQVCAVHFLMEGSVIYATDLDDGLGEQEIDFLSKYHYGNFSDDDFGIMVFTDEQAAEARLEELKGEKE